MFYTQSFGHVDWMKRYTSVRENMTQVSRIRSREYTSKIGKIK